MMKKNYNELSFTDDFMFCKVLENNPEICKELIEIILDTKIEIIEKIGTQQTIEITPDCRGVRLDVRMMGDQRIFNLEMQNARKENLPFRSRYYQGMLDLDQMGRGSKYNELMETFIIFICRFDPLGYGCRKYTVHTSIEEHPEIEYNDGTHKVFLSSLPDQKGTMSEELCQFLDYVNGTAAEGDFVRRLEEAVVRAKTMEEWRKEYMFLYEIKEEGLAEGLAEGLEKGRAEGLEEGRVSTITELVKDGVITPEEGAARLNQSVEQFRIILESSKPFQEEL